MVVPQFGIAGTDLEAPSQLILSVPHSAPATRVIGQFVTDSRNTGTVITKIGRRSVPILFCIAGTDSVAPSQLIRSVPTVPVPRIIGQFVIQLSGTPSLSPDRAAVSDIVRHRRGSVIQWPRHNLFGAYHTCPGPKDYWSVRDSAQRHTGTVIRSGGGQ